MKTLDAFDGAVDWAVNGSFTQDDIDEAKLSIFSQVFSLFDKKQEHGFILHTLTKPCEIVIM